MDPLIQLGHKCLIYIRHLIYLSNKRTNTPLNLLFEIIVPFLFITEGFSTLNYSFHTGCLS